MVYPVLKLRYTASEERRGRHLQRGYSVQVFSFQMIEGDGENPEF